MSAIASDDARERLLVVDDHPLFRRGVRQLIDMVEGFEVVGEAASGREGLEFARHLKPDMILLDLNMADMTGLQVLEVLKREGLDARVVMLTVSDQEDDVVAALRAGADGYLLKDMEPEDLVESLRRARRGHMVLSERLTGLLAHALRQEPRPRSTDEAGLTPQERKILDLLAAGKSNKLIARELAIADGTVKVHVKHILKKLNLRSRVEAAVWAVEQGRRS